MAQNNSLYIEQSSFLHRLDGGIKLIWVLCWSIFTFMFMDLRIFLALIVAGAILLKLSKIPFRNIKPMIIFVLIFTLLNALLLLIITPRYGSTLVGTTTEVISIGGFPITQENLFYVLTLSAKYVALLPITLIFLFTTHPSKFASSLNRIGVSYKIAYTVSIALRYIPDVRDEVKNITMAQEARGVAFRREDASIGTILKNYTTIVVPLVMGSLERIDVVANAMDLRGFGKDKKRTWYVRENLTRLDYIGAVGAVLLVVIGILLKSQVPAFWYPF